MRKLLGKISPEGVYNKSMGATRSFDLEEQHGEYIIANNDLFTIPT
jgi:hypothetical protein